MKNRIHRRKREMVAQLLAAECEAFLQGRYMQWLENRGRPVPAWAWLNGLAHGSPPVVVALAARRGDPNDPNDLVAGLASAVLYNIGQHDDSLAVVQESRLVPLEAKLFQYSGSAPPEDATELARWLVLGLSRQRRE